MPTEVEVDVGQDYCHFQLKPFYDFMKDGEIACQLPSHAKQTQHEENYLHLLPSKIDLARENKQQA